MNFNLIKRYDNDNLDIVSKVLKNRGVENSQKLIDIKTYGFAPNPPEAFGKELMAAAYLILKDALDCNKTIGLIVDSDCDGFTSAALMYNYLSVIKDPEWIKNHILIYIHEGKQHGLNDIKDQMIEDHIELCICPDGGSNDIDAQQELLANECDIIILDHHEVDFGSCPKNLFTKHFACINTQLGPYPNKQLSGVGVVYQFCKYFDQQNNWNNMDQFLDLLALGLMGDMQDLREQETLGYIWEGFSSKDNLINPFIAAMVDKNAFSLGKAE